MRGASPHGSTFPLYLHDGFNLWKFSDFVHGRQDFVVQDYHSYYVFTPSDASTPASKHSENVENGIFQMLISASGNQRRNLVIDEWSCALTTQSLSSEKDPDEARRRFCTGQMGVYATAAAGWSFWGTILFDSSFLQADGGGEQRTRRKTVIKIPGGVSGLRSGELSRQPSSRMAKPRRLRPHRAISHPSFQITACLPQPG